MSGNIEIEDWMDELSGKGFVIEGGERTLTKGEMRWWEWIERNWSKFKVKYDVLNIFKILLQQII